MSSISRCNDWPRIQPERNNEGKVVAKENNKSGSLEQPISFNIKNTNPYCYHFLKIEWAIFGSITWRSEYQRREFQQAARSRLRDFNNLIKRTCKALNLKHREIQFYFKNEHGRNSNCHVHFLIAKQGLKDISPLIVSKALNYFWTECFELQDGTPYFKGTAKIEPFDPKRQKEGVEYICKRERDRYGNELDTYDRLSPALNKRIDEMFSTQVMVCPPKIETNTTATPTLDSVKDYSITTRVFVNHKLNQCYYYFTHFKVIAHSFVNCICDKTWLLLNFDKKVRVRIREPPSRLQVVLTH